MALAAISFAVDTTGSNAVSSEHLQLTAIIAIAVFVALTLFREAQLYTSGRPDVQFVGSSPASNDVAIVVQEEGRPPVVIRPEAHFVRCRFENQVDSDNEGATAKALTGRITVLENGRTWLGRWSHTPEPQSTAEIWNLNQIDLAPNGQHVDLDIGCRYTTRTPDYRVDDFVPWYNEVLLRTRHIQNPPIQDAKFEIEIQLKASNMKAQQWRFRVANPEGPTQAVLTDWATKRLWWWTWSPVHEIRQ
ncbi:MAG TPA: hypothetical protein VMR52_01545 [Dehalococcoidia bacterium]|nr:hypothetical protein [Dehalococcoidia bacterium]